MPETATHRRVPLTVAAAAVPCSTKTIRRRIADGSLTGYRFGRKILIDLDELEAMVRPVAPAADKAAQ